MEKQQLTSLLFHALSQGTKHIALRDFCGTARASRRLALALTPGTDLVVQVDWSSEPTVLPLFYLLRARPLPKQGPKVDEECIPHDPIFSGFTFQIALLLTI